LWWSYPRDEYEVMIVFTGVHHIIKIENMVEGTSTDRQLWTSTAPVALWQKQQIPGIQDVNCALQAIISMPCIKKQR